MKCVACIVHLFVKFTYVYPAQLLDPLQMSNRGDAGALHKRDIQNVLYFRTSGLSSGLRTTISKRLNISIKSELQTVTAHMKKKYAY